MDEKFQVSEKTKSAFAAAEQKVSTAGSAIMKNRYILTGTSWVTGAFNRAAKAAGDVGQKTKEKVAEEEQGRNPAEEGHSQLNNPAEQGRNPADVGQKTKEKVAEEEQGRNPAEEGHAQLNNS
ncbi:hypothetical protein CsSME_00002211 [Camellia sinensis var. sinensis]